MKVNYILETLWIRLGNMEKPTIFDKRCCVELNDILNDEKLSYNFSKSFYDHIQRFNENKGCLLQTGKIFEPVVVQKGTKKKMKIEIDIYSYRYMHKGNNKNIRCLFIALENQNIFLSAFMEKDKKEYNKYIDKAVDRLNEILKGE